MSGAAGGDSFVLTCMCTLSNDFGAGASVVAAHHTSLCYAEYALTAVEKIVAALGTRRLHALDADFRAVDNMLAPMLASTVAEHPLLHGAALVDEIRARRPHIPVRARTRTTRPPTTASSTTSPSGSPRARMPLAT